MIFLHSGRQLLPPSGLPRRLHQLRPSWGRSHVWQSWKLGSDRDASATFFGHERGSTLALSTYKKSSRLEASRSAMACVCELESMAAVAACSRLFQIAQDQAQRGRHPPMPQPKNSINSPNCSALRQGSIIRVRFGSFASFLRVHATSAHHPTLTVKADRVDWQPCAKGAIWPAGFLKFTKDRESIASPALDRQRIRRQISSPAELRRAARADGTSMRGQ